MNCGVFISRALLLTVFKLTRSNKSINLALKCKVFFDLVITKTCRFLGLKDQESFNRTCILICQYTTSLFDWWYAEHAQTAAGVGEANMPPVFDLWSPVAF